MIVDRRANTRIDTLYQAFAAAHASCPTGKLRFADVEGCDVYNPSTPFRSGGRRVIAGRVERRDSEESTAVFFEARGDAWYPVAGAPRFRLQDPFITTIGGELVFGGVETSPAAYGLSWRTVFYRGPDLFQLRRCFEGPLGMKDIRLRELVDGRVGIFTRPRGLIGERGMIGYTEVDSLDALSEAAIEAAPLITDMFHPLDWGGANEAHLLQSGEIGVIAHAAYFADDDADGERRYYATAFVFDPSRRSWRNHRVIASRRQFAPGPAKRTDLVDVVFSSGVEPRNGGFRLYAGTSDAEAQWVDIPDPFGVPLLHQPGPA
ncbi:DUF1861 family protein [Sphingomonas azotifigens]|uniref:DUF1861 family protein n=1 Tax=Sphingomonas azotifigens TaxID=330920 RepID=UPI0009FFC205|nr:DUF1861 family protein [Sphingomonas azotifigens]